MRRYLLIGLLVAASVGPGCRLIRRGGTKPIPPAPPPPVLQPPEPVARVPKQVPEPPEIPPETIDVTALPEPDIPHEPWPPPPRRRRPPRREAEVTATEPPAEPAAPPPAPVPQLAQVLSPEQQQAYSASIERNLDRAQRTVAALRGKRLSREQATYMERIRAFIEQAGEARKTDLVRAASLAERASVLAEDLLKSVQ